MDTVGDGVVRTLCGSIVEGVDSVWDMGVITFGRSVVDSLGDGVFLTLCQSVVDKGVLTLYRFVVDGLLWSVVNSVGDGEVLTWSQSFINSVGNVAVLTLCWSIVEGPLWSIVNAELRGLRKAVPALSLGSERHRKAVNKQTLDALWT